MSIAVAVLGLVLPLLPTTSFLLAAAGGFGRSSPAIVERVRTHPRFGAALQAFQDERPFLCKSKIAAVAGLSLSWAITVRVAERWRSSRCDKNDPRHLRSVKARRRKFDG